MVLYFDGFLIFKYYSAWKNIDTASNFFILFFTKFSWWLNSTSNNKYLKLIINYNKL